MNFTRKEILDGCLIASIAHGIMTNLYPELSYEQSWDGANYSIQDSSGIRGTITFESDYCVGAIRNDASDFVVSGKAIQDFIRWFPAKIALKANEETLQYLLLEESGMVEPCATSVFWADDFAIHFDEAFSENIQRDFVLLERIFLPARAAIEEWIDYYDMPLCAVELLNELYQIKSRDFRSEIVLSATQKNKIPGSYINDECVESLRELNILL